MTAVPGELRVAVASSGLGHIARGIETWAGDLGEALHVRRVAVRLYQGGGPAPAYGEALANLPRESEANYRWRHRLPRSVAWRLQAHAAYQMEQTTFAWSLLRALRRDRADILHVQDPVVAYRLEQFRRMGLLRTRTILAHGTEEPPAWLMKLRYLQHLAPTHLERCRAQGAWRPTWTAIGNFVDTDRFQPGSAAELRAELGIAADARVVLAVAAIKRAHKRIDWLANAVARYRSEHPDMPVVLVVAGGREGDTDDVIHEATAQLGDSVRFLVRYPRERIPALFRVADVFVMASLFEMMPIALLEATASGLPCITHDEATLRWMTGAGGIATDMSDAAAFGAAMHRLLENDQDRRALGVAARKHAVSEFGTEPILQQILAYYRAVLADTP
ncbi:MAG TPA: glycosyltransferase family 4 protein [Gemmatimonadales bacterium]|jgi:glycosyltransferase involved in cell wall biosynthesis|nr:glycosyltransferase family 4 protein [Gemmatimonadales bacterium]